MTTNTLISAMLKELVAEEAATKKCIERIPEKVYDFKPHSKSTTMGYLTLLVAEIPLWITHMIEAGEIDFATFKHAQPKNTDEMVTHFEANMRGAKKSLQSISDADLQRPFHLKANGQLIMTAPLEVNITSSLNHWVHHRGQLTVYMRLNDIAVPSIYGPSADDNPFR